jgi:hypothetical protein
MKTSHAVWLTGMALLLSAMSHPAGAAAFQEVTYDAVKDELVISVIYDGITPNHRFSFAWEQCIDRGDNHHQISVQLLDAQFQEPARQTYTQTLHLSLKDMDCRPGELTVRTIPNNLYTVQIPAHADAQ